MKGSPEAILSHFERSLEAGVLQEPGWTRFRQDYKAYFSKYPASLEAREFGTVFFQPCLDESTSTTELDKYYFYQNTWASRKIFRYKPSSVVDIGSTTLYAGIISQFVPTTFVDIRPIHVNLPGLTILNGSILDLPFQEGSQGFVTSLCVLEHIGLGRYGDPILPDGTRRACAEIDRILKVGAQLIVSTNIGPPCIVFNAHRIFSREQFLSYFPGYSVLDEVYLAPEPSGEVVLRSLQPGCYVVYVVHLLKTRASSHKH